MKGHLALAALAAGLIAAAPAGAATNSLEGSCSLAGTATFASPLVGAPNTSNGYVFAGTGACTGKINGVAATNRSMFARVVQKKATLSCGFSASQAADGTITFVNGILDADRTAEDTTDPDDTVVHFLLDEASVGTEVPLRATGASSGTAFGEATFRDSAGPATVTTCAGAGISSIGFTASVQTLNGPLVG